MDFWNRHQYRDYLYKNVKNYKLITPCIDNQDFILWGEKNGYNIDNVSIGLCPFYCYHIMPFNKKPIKKICFWGKIDPTYQERVKLRRLKFNNVDIIPYKTFNGNNDYKRYLSRLNKYICCIVTGVNVFRNSAILMKYFEVLSTGALLIASKKDIVMMNKIGLVHAKNCFICNFDDNKNIRQSINYIINPKNKNLIDRIRKKGYELGKKLSATNKYNELQLFNNKL